MRAEILRLAEYRLFRYGAPIVLGGLVALAVVKTMHGPKQTTLFLALFAFLVLIPAFLVRSAKHYFLLWFLFALAFELKKNLLDGFAVLSALRMDWEQFVFLPEIRASDLPLLILLLFWLYEIIFERKRVLYYKYNFLALGFLFWAGFTVLLAQTPYLGVVEILRQFKYFIIFLYMCNNIDSKRFMRVLWIGLVAGLMVQDVVTILRYRFKYFEPLESLIGARGVVDTKKRDEYLLIDKSGTTMKSFGTLQSPSSTTKFSLLIFPAAFWLCLRNPVMRRRMPFVILTFLSMVMFYLTFARSSFIAVLLEVVLCYWLAWRRGYLEQRVAGALFGVFLLGAIGAAPFLYKFMFAASRTDAIQVRFRQYEMALGLISENLLFGVGLNNSPGAQREYAKYLSVGANPIERAAVEPIHSAYIALVVEIGIVGVLLYLAFFATILKRCGRMARSDPDPAARFTCNIILIAFIGIATGVLTDPLFEDSVHSILWIYCGVVVVFDRLQGRPLPELPP